MTIHAIIPASGLSSRMGACKSLLKLGSETLLAYQVRFLSELGLAHIHVTSSDDSDLIAEIKTLNVNCIHTYECSHSMLESVRIAIGQLPATCSGVMVLPSDHPPQNKRLYQLLKSSFDSHLESIIVPSFNYKRGHPVFIPRKFFAPILTDFDKTGLRGLYRSASDSVVHIESPDGSILRNLNTPDQWSEFINKFSNG